MHPLIKILGFIIFAILVSVGTLDAVVAGAMLLTVVWLVSRSYPNKRCLAMLRRMKILFISIFLVYLWFTPGELMLPALDNWSPTYEGLTLALLKVSALAVLILGVTSLLRLTPKDQLVCGIYYVSYPMTWFGMQRDKLISRTVLTLELASEPLLPRKSSRQKLALSQYMDVLVNKFVESFHQALEPETSLADLNVQIMPPPSIPQWLILFGFLGFVVAILWM